MRNCKTTKSVICNICLLIILKKTVNCRTIDMQYNIKIWIDRGQTLESNIWSTGLNSSARDYKVAKRIKCLTKTQNDKEDECSLKNGIDDPRWEKWMHHKSVSNPFNDKFVSLNMLRLQKIFVLRRDRVVMWRSQTKHLPIWTWEKFSDKLFMPLWSYD